MVDLRFLCQTEYADSFKNAESAECVDIAGIFGNIKTDLNMALRGEVINLIRLNFCNNYYER